MKNFQIGFLPAIFLAAGFFSATAVHAEDNEVKIEAPISSVIVYLSGAEVTQSKHVTLAPGRNELKFVGLSSKLIPRSIQFNATGDVSILAISNRIDYLYGELKNDARTKQLTDSLNMANDQLQIINGQIEAYQKEKTM